MDIEQLRQLDAIARCGTISAAAKVCHVSQPALSRSIQRLEAECGQQLFSRSKNHLDLNEAGSIVLEHARAILREERSMHDALDRLSQRERMLAIGTVAPAPIWMLTELTVEKFPGTIFKIDSIKEGEAAGQLLGRTIDMAVTTAPVNLPGCVSVRMMDEHLSAMIPLSNPLSSRATVSFEKLDGESFLVDSAGGFWLDMLRDRLPHARFIEQADRNVLFKLVASNNLITFSTNATESWGTPKGFVRVPIDEEEAHVTFYLSALSDAPDRVRDIIGLIPSTEI